MIQTYKRTSAIKAETINTNDKARKCQETTLLSGTFKMGIIYFD
jgi:hypothetical protein